MSLPESETKKLSKSAKTKAALYCLAQHKHRCLLESLDCMETYAWELDYIGDA